ncbi:TetR/AcrR family transcriptional regulator [Panacibacter ginsenosidivorans]|uniref:TetR/AcrR family transcriptional regulator n=1 Tax=Panacibacter ginsenosidivorans TaxID=1813871 RepID=A0A5B8V8M2_9BACT|nr:TetR/AcrR family transcriptional regulator [Panacibacter ginsenosidivorans]QEC67890.1 TetR/AcrR family transcriptional regulator [Panacibacter ginsenosidivorans]
MSKKEKTYFWTMSNDQLNTREKILNKALEMFNAKGVEYVGLRELAASLDMRVSNITYYFPTKDNLVNQLSLDLNKLNSEFLVHDKSITMHSFLAMLRNVFRNQLRYRCMLLSIVHLMEQNKEMSVRHKKTQKDRNATLRANINSLTESGYLKVYDENETEYLVSTIALIARFWISEATISFRQLSAEDQLNYYLSLVGKLLSSYATTKGKKQIQLFLRKLKEPLST